MSSMNSGVFSTSRMLFGLAREGQAPQSLARLSKRAVPAKGLFFSCASIMAGAALQYFVPNTVEAFTLASSLCVILFISIWSIIMVCYIRYRKLRPELHAKSTFKMPGGVRMSYVVLIFLFFTLIILSLEADTLRALMISPLWVIILAVTYQSAVQAAYEKTSVRAATGQLSNIYSVLVMFQRKPCISQGFLFA